MKVRRVGMRLGLLVVRPFGWVGPHAHRPMAQVPSAIRELTKFVPSMLMYSSIFAFLIFLFVRVPLSSFDPAAGCLRLQESKDIYRPAKCSYIIRTISFGAVNECMSPKRESGPR